MPKAFSTAEITVYDHEKRFRAKEIDIGRFKRQFGDVIDW